MKQSIAIREGTGDWRDIPDVLITEAMCDLPINATHEQFAEYIARRMELSGKYDMEFRQTDDAGATTVKKSVSGTTFPAPEGAPIITLPGGIHLVAQHFTPEKRSDDEK